MTTGRFGFFQKLAMSWALAVLLGGLIDAQTSGSGTITGTVTDPSGSVVPGATVTVKNTDTGIQRKILTNEAGRSARPGVVLRPSHYCASCLGLIVAIALFAMGTTIRIRSEERLLRNAFGEEFDAYAQKVPAIVPFMF